MILINGDPVNVEHFPDGTQRIHIDIWTTSYITWKYEKEEELSTLIYITRHLKNIGCNDIELFLYYMPNARMDRIHNETEVFTLKSFADVINWLGFNKVYTLDVHSNVGEALINNLHVTSPKKYIEYVLNNIGGENKNDVILYFPDAGAAKRYSGMFPDNRFCYGEKIRDWDTGEIKGLEVRTNGIDLKDKTVLMIDDIISYGGSLYYSALKLKELGVGCIFAYATHTEDSILDKEKGTLIKALEDGTVHLLYTTDSLFNKIHDYIHVLQLNY